MLLLDTQQYGTITCYVQRSCDSCSKQHLYKYYLAASSAMALRFSSHHQGDLHVFAGGAECQPLVIPRCRVLHCDLKM